MQMEPPQADQEDQMGHADDTPRSGNGHGVEVEDRTRDWRAEAETAGARVREFVTEHPLAAVGIALSAGFLVGRLMRR